MKVDMPKIEEHCPVIKKSCRSYCNGRAEWATHLSVTTVGIDKPFFPDDIGSGLHHDNGVHVASNRGALHIIKFRDGDEG